MKIEIDVNNTLNKLDERAKNKLEKKVGEYANQIIKTSIEIEDTTKEAEADDDLVHENSVIRAVKNYNIYPNKKKVNSIQIFLHIVSELTLLLVGFMYNPDAFVQGQEALLWFILILIVAVGTTVSKYLWKE